MRYALYDPDTKHLLSTDTWADYRDAVANIDSRVDAIVVALDVDEPEDQSEEDDEDPIRRGLRSPWSDECFDE